MDRTQILALIEERANVWNEQQSLLDVVTKRGDGFSGEEEAKWQKLDGRVSSLTDMIERSEKMLKADSANRAIDDKAKDQTGASKDFRDAAFRKWLAFGREGLEIEEKRALAAGPSFELGAEARALSTVTGGAGGFTVPTLFWDRVAETMLAYSNMMQYVNRITTDTGADLPWMSNDDTTNKGSILGEGVTIGTQDLTFGARSLGAYLYTSNLVKVSYQLLQDSAIDIESFLARKLGVRLARIHNQHFTTGTGTAQPDGIVTGATTGKTTASSTAITVNEIIDLIHSVDPAYRGAPNVAFMLNDLVLAYLRKIKDDFGGAGLGRPIWEPSLQVGVPSTLLGYPVVINQDMASSVATTNTTALFGDFQSGYVVRQVRNMQLVRLDERYADSLQVGFFAFDRMDGTKDDTAAYKALVQV